MVESTTVSPMEKLELMLPRRVQAGNTAMTARCDPVTACPVRVAQSTLQMQDNRGGSHAPSEGPGPVTAWSPSKNAPSKGQGPVIACSHSKSVLNNERA